MNINQYMCNMKVLVGLFLANSIGLITNFTYTFCYDYYSPKINMGLDVYLRRIEANIWHSKSYDHMIYAQERSDTHNHPEVLSVFLM